jgi:hypothetical protein
MKEGDGEDWVLVKGRGGGGQTEVQIPNVKKNLIKI